MNSVENQQICSRFVEPEKLADLRTKREIEVMNGRPWTRELPPPPVLPPYGPLEKISGNCSLSVANIFGSILMQLPTGPACCRRYQMASAELPPLQR